MDTLKTLIGILMRMMFAIFFVAFVWWMVSLLYPSLGMLSIKQTLFGTEKKDFLPSPRAYGSFLKDLHALPVQTGTVSQYQPTAYSQVAPQEGYTYSTVNYVTYTASNTLVVVDQKGDLVSPSLDDYNKKLASQQSDIANATTSHFRSVYLRNLSIYEGGSIRQGLSFIGEARESMFRNGSFPVIILDQNKKVIGVSTASLSTKWSVPGWVRFEVKIVHQIPFKGPCTMIFQEALTEEEYKNRQPVRIPLSVGCN
jgi:hypothetical protein